jgi:hypothetical protein
MKIDDLSIITQPSAKSIFFKIQNKSDITRRIDISKSYFPDAGRRIYAKERHNKKSITVEPGDINIFRLYRSDLKELFQDRGFDVPASEEKMLSNLGEKLVFILVIDDKPIEMVYLVVHIMKGGYYY